MEEDPRDLLGMDPVQGVSFQDDDSWRRHFASGRAGSDARLHHNAVLSSKDRKKAEAILDSMAYKP